MATIVKVSCFPNEGTPVVIAGDPQLGDIVRITSNTGTVIYERYTPQPAPLLVPSSYAAQEFAASIRRRADKLSARGQSAEATYLLRKHGL